MKTIFAMPLLLLALTFAAGCSRYEIRPLANESQAVLDADQTVQLLLQVGLDDEAILEHGPEIRDTLARTGAVQIRNGRYTLAILAAHPPYIYLTSRHKGSMIYPLEPGAAVPAFAEVSEPPATPQLPDPLPLDPGPDQ